MTNIYSDEDGVATKESQAAYDARVRMLRSLIVLLSWLGLCVAVLNGEYARENLHLTSSLTQLIFLHGTKFLWVSRNEESHQTVSCVYEIDLILSLS